MYRRSASGLARARHGPSATWGLLAVKASSTVAAIQPACFSFLTPPPLIAPLTALQCALRHCHTKQTWLSGQQQQRPTSSASKDSAHVVTYAPWEVRALVLPLLPTATSLTEHSDAAPHSRNRDWNWPSQVQQQLPRALRQFLEREVRSTSSAGDGQSSAETQQCGGRCALVEYMLRHFPQEVVLLPRGHLAVRVSRAPAAIPAASTSERGAGPATTDAAHPSATAALLTTESAATPLEDRRAAGSFPPLPAQQVSFANAEAPPPPFSPRSSASEPHTLLRTPVAHADSTKPPPPPVPQSNSCRYGTGGAAAAAATVAGGGLVAPRAHFGGAGAPNAFAGPTAAATVETSGQVPSAPAPLRSTLQVMEALVQYIPTFFTSIDAIEPTLPSEIQKLYADTSLRFYIKRFRHYVDTRAAHGSVEIRLRADFDHPQRGYADARFSVGGFSSLSDVQPLRRPPRNSEMNLIGLVAPQVPKAYAPLADILQEIAPIISRHPAFDPRLGVTGLLGKYPEYFQMAQGKLRARPYRVAPNSLDECDAATSPLPSTFAKVLAVVIEAAAGKNYSIAEEKAAAAVSTGRLYSLLTPMEKAQVKTRCRSFPTFLRMHGKEIVVSVDKMKVYRFLPEYEACVDTLMDERLRMNSIRPDDPVLKIPSEMAPESNAEWAVRELYDALPLMQCAELDEVLSLVPTAVRDALPRELVAVRAVLDNYPDYFTTWPYPDDPSVIVVQRAKVEQPTLEKTEIVRMVLPLIPQGGTTLASLRTRVPLALQRYFSRHGTVATLGAMKDVFAISGDRIVRLV
ncbi:hypothetical protein LSCM1_03193 [Leishmania martiniquensis]|uniref:Uncharacterized protein n=1 Tax=Leishmania martiniquensis TaxID=1580590 RepID=A0A836KHJ0_9TRYP|nr:hypothetical protein LSCM1_03193 [Leishmania martiniquensis]